MGQQNHQDHTQYAKVEDRFCPRAGILFLSEHPNREIGSLCRYQPWRLNSSIRAPEKARILEMDGDRKGVGTKHFLVLEVRGDSVECIGIQVIKPGGGWQQWNRP